MREGGERGGGGDAEGGWRRKLLAKHGECEEIDLNKGRG